MRAEAFARLPACLPAPDDNIRAPHDLRLSRMGDFFPMGREHGQQPAYGKPKVGLIKMWGLSRRRLLGALLFGLLMFSLTKYDGRSWTHEFRCVRSHKVIFFTCWIEKNTIILYLSPDKVLSKVLYFLNSSSLAYDHTGFKIFSICLVTSQVLSTSMCGIKYAVISLWKRNQEDLKT